MLIIMIMVTFFTTYYSNIVWSTKLNSTSGIDGQPANSKILLYYLIFYVTVHVTQLKSHDSHLTNNSC